MKNILLALIAALVCIMVPLGTEAVQPRLEARLAWDMRSGFDFGLDVDLEIPLWRGP